MCGGNHYGCSNAAFCSGAGAGYSASRSSGPGGYSGGGSNYQSAPMYSSGPATYSIDAVVNYSMSQPEYNLSPAISENHADTARIPAARSLHLDEYHFNPLKYTLGLYLQGRTGSKGYDFTPGSFLSPEREEAEFVETNSQVMEHVKEAFKEMTGREFPHEFIRIHVCSPKEMEDAHGQFGGVFSENIRGFAVNRIPRPSDIFVLQDNMDSLMLTIGHEIGHCITPSLRNKRDEEAKAFSFSMAWMDAIKRNDIAGIGKSIRMKHQPAKNNIHDKAFDFVKRKMAEGNDAMQLFRNIAACGISADGVMTKYW